MNIIETAISDVLLIEPDVFGDRRGFFLETWNEQRYQKAGFPAVNFVQDNISRSSKGVLRGLHFQLTHPQGKLIKIIRGSVFDVTVDLRPGSPTFGDWIGYELNDENHRQLWIPPGMAHGFCVLSEVADFSYKCTDFYHPEDEGGILWNDPDLAINWPMCDVLVSEKDQKLPELKTLTPEALPK